MVKYINFRGKCDFVEARADSRLYGNLGLIENENIIQESVNVPTNYGNTVMTLINNPTVINPSTSSQTYKQLVVNTTGGQINVNINNTTNISVPSNSGITLCWLKPLGEWIQVH